MIVVSENKIKKIFLIALFILLHASSSTMAQQAVSGEVIDKKTNEPLIGATVVEKGTINASKTDYNGHFSLKVDLSSPKILVFSYLGYNAKEVSISTSQRYIKVSMEAAVVESKEVLVAATRLSEKLQESPVTIERMNIAAIKETPAVGFYEGLANLKGVDMTTASLGFKIINTRGFNSTSPVRTLQLIDGIDNQAPGLNFALGNFVGSSELDIENVDLVVGANSATYGPNAFNGVISMKTKDPFNYRGLNVQIKGGSHDLFDGSLRYAKVFKEKLGFKVNLSYLNATDFEAKNYNPIDSRNAIFPSYRIDPLAGYDAVNIYGEVARNEAGLLSSPQAQYDTSLVIFRTGYKEKDLVHNYNTSSLKMNGGLYWKFFKENTLSYIYNFGTGTTIYQGENRYSIKDILFQQHKLELRGERFFVKAYTTLEDAGNSYDIVFTARKLMQSVKDDTHWFNDFEKGYFNARKSGRTKEQALADARIAADGPGIVYKADKARLEPGTQAFNDSLAKITSNPSFRSGGTKFQDNSNLVHYEAQYNFNLSKVNDFLPKDFKVGANLRDYNPRSYGTIFSDTLIDKKDINKGFTSIHVREWGTYINTEKKIFKEKLNLIGSLRLDKSQNFKASFSPAFSMVYELIKNNNIRMTYSTAVRNPTLQDQYLLYDIGFIILEGNVKGKDMMLLGDFPNYIENGVNKITHINPVKPEQVRSIEFGYKGILFEKIYVDASYYYSVYRDFIGYLIGLRDPSDHKPYQFYRVSSNAKGEVSSDGFSIGTNYYFDQYFSIAANYTNAFLNKHDSKDPLIPNFNTPPHKYNLSFGGRNIYNFGFNITYKWVDGYDYTGSPQFTGYIPAYGLTDAQVNYKIKKIKSTVKLGCSNIFNNEHFEAYGGPFIGRLMYASINFEL